MISRRAVQGIALIVVGGILALSLQGCFFSDKPADAEKAAATKDGKGLFGNGFVPAGAKWQPVSQDQPDPNGYPVYVSRIPIPSRDAWLYRCVSTGGVALVVVPDDNIPAEKKK